MSLLNGALEMFARWWTRRQLRLNRPWGRTIYLRNDGRPYLHRFYLVGRDKTMSLFLHKFVSSDPPEAGLHDHPWAWSVSLVLVNGYAEERLENHEPVGELPLATTWRVLRPWQFNFIRGYDYHRVELFQSTSGEIPAWTLFLHGPRAKSWGFCDTATGKVTPFEEVQG